MPQWFVIAAFGLLGLLIGSFANVVIWRFPRGESLVSPGSHCPGCGHAVRWHDNIPVISWLLLRGKCRDCEESIPLRYPLVEALSGLLLVAAALRFDATWQAALAAAFFWTLLVLTFIDLDTMRLPNPIVGALALLGLVAAVISQFSPLHLAPLTGNSGSPAFAAALGLVLGGGLSWTVAGAYALVRGTSGFGMGDVKLLGAMGLFLGPYVVVALMIGSFAGAVVGVVAASRSGEGLSRKVPFGPFLAIGAVITALAGPQLWGWYLSLAGMA